VFHSFAPIAFDCTHYRNLGTDNTPLTASDSLVKASTSVALVCPADAPLCGDERYTGSESLLHSPRF
jgi:hypothetical protein